MENKTGMIAELTFLETWGKIYKQTWEDTKDSNFFHFYIACCDAHLVLSGKQTNFQSAEVLPDKLTIVGNYFGQLAIEGVMTADIAASRKKYMHSIVELLRGSGLCEPFQPYQFNLFEA